MGQVAGHKAQMWKQGPGLATAVGEISIPVTCNVFSLLRNSWARRLVKNPNPQPTSQMEL